MRKLAKLGARAVRAGASLIAAVTVASAALAQAPTTESTPIGRAPVFEWTAPAQCPSGDGVASRVERYLGRALATVPTEVQRVEASVRRTTMGFRLEIRTITAEARRLRVMDHADCEALAKAASVVIAIALDPTSIERVHWDDPSDDASDHAASSDDDEPAAVRKAESGPTPTDAPGTVEPGNAPDVSDVVRPGRGSVEPSDDSALLFPSAALAGQWGPLPEPGLGISVGLELWLQPLWIEVYGNGWSAQTRSVTGLDGGAVELGLWGGGLQVGAGGRFGALRWGILGLGVELGMSTADPKGLEASHRARSLWLAGSLSTRLALDLGAGLEAVAQLGALTPVRRTRYEIDDFGPIHVARRFGGRVQLGLGWVIAP